MSRYAFLILPSHNRVYTDAAAALVRAELEVLNAAVLGGRISGSWDSEIGGVPYVTFETDGDLSEHDARLLANLSSLYALFLVEGDSAPRGDGLDGGAVTGGAVGGAVGTTLSAVDPASLALRPVPLRRLDRLDDDLITIQKYAGKTNEQFTKLLLNVTLLSSAFAGQFLTRRFTVLDPLCGRGTTLNQALMYGFDACGTDTDRRDVEAYAVFIQRWLKDKRLKHQADFSPVRRNHQTVARRLRASFAATKEEYKAGDVQRLDVVDVETTRLLEFFKPGLADVVVADLPYGVQHGSHASGSRRGITRTPLDLLAEAAPVWAKALRPGGALGISLNTFVAKREDAAQALIAAGLDVLDGGPYGEFRHRVDQAIMRDILVARKPGETPSALGSQLQRQIGRFRTRIHATAILRWPHRDSSRITARNS